MNSSFRNAIFAGSLFLVHALGASPEKPNFEDDLIPLFEESCNSCHNPDKAKGGLDLTSMNGILAGGSSGDVALPGESITSPALSRVYFDYGSDSVNTNKPGKKSDLWEGMVSCWKPA